MASFHFVLMFGLSFALISCEGKIIPPPDGTVLTFLPGSSRNITWDFDDEKVASRTWTFTSSDGLRSGILGVIALDGKPQPQNGVLPRFNIIKPATLELNNVNHSYNGIYKFTLTVATESLISNVVVFIAKKPTVTLNCSSHNITLNETDDFTCVCRGEGGNPPANVTWYKNNKRFGGTKKLNNSLTLSNIKRTANGTYKCEARSHTNDSFKDEKSFKLRVNFQPIIKSFKSDPDPPINGKEVTLRCESDGVPEPGYMIKFENGSEASSTKTYYIPIMGSSYDGNYTCIAKNIKGNDSAILYLTGQEQGPTTTQTTAIHTTKSNSTTPPGNNGTVTSPTENGNGGTDIGLIIGIVIGVLAFIVIVCVAVYCCKSKEKDRRNRGDVDPVAGNHYELDNEEPGPGDNAYDTVAPGGESGSKKKAPQKDSLPPVYAAVDKNNRQGNTLYASLDTDALKRESKKEPTNRTPQTEYASIDFANNPDVPKADLV